MKKVLLSLSLLGLFATAAHAQQAIVQLGPTTPYSTIVCADFVKQPDGAWIGVGRTPFGLGFIQGIIPPVRPIKAGGYIYNNIDLYSQLEEQCHGTVVVRARY